MNWATRDNLHLDRVACSWLVRRFLDPGGLIAFVPPAEFDRIPAGTITFGIPGGVFTPHDERGTAFAKMLRHYREAIPEGSRRPLEMLEIVVDAGVKVAIGRENEIACAPEYRGLGESLAALSEGFVFLAEDDEDLLRLSMSLYDAFLAYFAGRVLVDQDPALSSLGLLARLHEIRARIRAQD